jgi:heme a synthase
MDLKSIRRFILLAQVTLVFVYFVIIAGSIVRATGSGMGCPDWPKCFGRWIPPTSTSQLPENYKELYAGEHHAVAEFNVLNTWTEYLNRLVGALLGFLIFAQFLFSIKIRKSDKRIFLLSLIELILIGFQGWLGAKVVSSNLAPVKITIHMIVALIILSLAIIIIYRAKQLNESYVTTATSSLIKKLTIIALIFTIIQIMLGTQIREGVDLLLKNFDAAFRNQVVDNLGTSFKIHRTFSILIMIINLWLAWSIIKSNTDRFLKNTGKWLAVILIAEVVVGIVLSRFSLPAVLQPVHLLLACIAFGLQFTIILRALRN